MKILPRSEELVLLAILHLRDEAYGVTIRRYLAQVTGQNVSISSVDTTSNPSPTSPTEVTVRAVGPRRRGG